MEQALRQHTRPADDGSVVPPLSVVRSNRSVSRDDVPGKASRRFRKGCISALIAGTLVLLATWVPGSHAAWGVFAWATGWLYLAWAVDARTGRALGTDLLLAGLTLCVVAWVPAAAIWLIFLGHAGAGWLRCRTGGKDARLAPMWVGIHLGIAAALLIADLV